MTAPTRPTGARPDVARGLLDVQQHLVDPLDHNFERLAADHPERLPRSADAEETELARVDSEYQAAARSGVPWEIDDYQARIATVHAWFDPKGCRK